MRNMVLATVGLSSLVYAVPAETPPVNFEPMSILNSQRLSASECGQVEHGKCRAARLKVAPILMQKTATLQKSSGGQLGIDGASVADVTADIVERAAVQVRAAENAAEQAAQKAENAAERALEVTAKVERDATAVAKDAGSTVDAATVAGARQAEQVIERAAAAIGASDSGSNKHYSEFEAASSSSAGLHTRLSTAVRSMLGDVAIPQWIFLTSIFFAALVAVVSLAGYCAGINVDKAPLPTGRNSSLVSLGFSGS